MDELLKVENITKVYGDNVVVNNVSFNLQKGKIYGLLGPNGAGKTTIMKIINDQVSLNGGAVKFDESVKIRYLKDVPQFYEYMSVKEFLSFLLKLNKCNDVESKLNELLHVTNLKEEKDKKIKKLSRGLRQKLGIASVLVTDVDILVLDEPVSALDPVSRQEILDLIVSLKGKTCVIFSSHILEDIEKICDHILLIHRGKLLLNDESDTIIKTENELLVQCATREQVLALKDTLEIYEFSADIENALVIPYNNLIAAQQDILKKAKKLQLDVILMEKRRKTLQEIFITEVKKHG